MAFEPKVLECIGAYRRKARRDRVVLVTPFVLAAAASLALLVLTVFLERGVLEFFPVSWLQPDNPLTMLLKILVAWLMVIVVGLFGYDLCESVRYARARFYLFLDRRAAEYDVTAARKFRNALDGAALAAGVDPPALVILDDPAANALGFEDGEGGRAVGATTGLLDAGIPVGEANAIMAHELAHLLIGENVSAPSLVDVEFLPSGLVVVFGTLSMLSVLVAPPSPGYMLMELGVTALVFLALLLVYRSRAFITRMLDLAHHHDDILADSLAAKITGDPGALDSAIRRLTGTEGSRGRIPGGTMLARYMFVTPPAAEGDYFRYASRVAGRMLTGKKTPRTWMLNHGFMDEAMRNLLEMERAAGKKRLINLGLVCQGRWRALEEWSRD